MRLISKVDIEGFRSIRSTTLSGISDFTTLAGLNNSGKSNALRALNAFFNGQTDTGTELDVDDDYYAPDRRKKKAKRISVGVTFSLPNQFRFRKGLEAVEQLLGNQNFKIQKVWRRDGAVPSYFLNDHQLGLGDQQKIDQFLNLVNFRYVPNRVLPVDVIKQEHQALRDLLVRRLGRRTGEHQGAFSAIRDTSQAMIETLVERLTEASPDIGNIRLATPNSWSDMAFAFGYRLGQGDLELADAVQGSGIQSLLMLETLYLIDRDYFQRFGWKQAAVWAVEEPESSLHSSLEARVASFLSSIAVDTNSRLQVFCTTHSDLMIQYSGSVIVTSKNHAETICQLFTDPRQALENVSGAGIARWVHPVLFWPLDPIILVEGKLDREFFEEALKHIRPKRPVRIVDLPSLDSSNPSGGVDRMRQYIKEHASAIKTRRPTAPVVVVLDWDAASKRDQFAKMVDAPDVYKVIAWPQAALNPNAGKSLRGIERAHCDRVLELAIQRGAPIARKQKKGAPNQYVVDSTEYNEVKVVLAAIVQEGLQAADLVHATPLIKEVLNKAEAG